MAPSRPLPTGRASIHAEAGCRYQRTFGATRSEFSNDEEARIAARNTAEVLLVRKGFFAFLLVIEFGLLVESDMSGIPA
jgi:hypothetical protein